MIDQLHDWVEIQVYALQIGLSAVAVCGLVLLAARVLRRRSEPLRYGILLSGVIGLLAIPGLVGICAMLPAEWIASLPEAEDEVVRVPAEMLSELLARSGEVPADGDAPEAALSSGQVAGYVMLALWLLGTALGLSRLCVGLWRQNRALVGKVWQPDFWTDTLRTRLADKLGLRRFPEVFVSPVAPMPLVLGFWRPVIVVPECSPASWGQSQWEAVLLHEAAHIARRDHWAILAQRLAVILFWWSPLVYLLGRRLNDLRESICDDYALQGPCDHFAYAELLVESAERLLDLKLAPAPLALLDSAHGGLEARLNRLLEKERKPMTKLSLAGRVLACVFLAAACLATTAATAFSQTAPAPQKKVQIKIIVDGKEIDLGDAKLLEHIEAAQKKTVPGPAFKIVVDKDQLKAEVVEKKITFTPDGKYIVTGGERVLLYDVQTGKLISQAPVTGAVDPRIEALVKQAEAIKPGSGAEVRKALQAQGKSVTATFTVPVQPPMQAIELKKFIGGAGHLRTDEDLKKFVDHLHSHTGGAGAGKKVIILSVEDGKVVQLADSDVKKLIEAGIRLHPAQDKKSATVEPVFEYKLVLPMATTTKPAPMPTPSAAELDSLRRQLERITAELQDLRKRVDAGKK